MINLRQQIPHYLRLMRFDKPVGIFLLLWPTLWAVWIAAKGAPSFKITVIFIAGSVVMRAAGCIVNDFADRHLDKHVQRTQMRPLASGSVSVTEAMLLFAVLSLIAFTLVLLLNRLTVELAVIGTLLVLVYPFLKRFTHLPQLWLGVAFSWSIPMVFAATVGHVPAVAWLLFFTAVLWPIVYDTQYAMIDREDDIKIGIKSTAILFGRYDRLMIGLLQGIVLLTFGFLGCYLRFNYWFYLGWLVALGLMCYQQFLIRHRKPLGCFTAFWNNHWVGFFIFLGILLAYRN
ncbi:4-hydroxybenzoate octaprenyltransferase [Coxiella endosymbiont of Ornithodoros amblus]|uniref:4-hydroxybenzoate octaprenyltransferase n=1 Tax=Coxiella endosymbiont of Ornithodoros amblus TaxID=1656166 RepID=UPI00244E30B2|nr:4-hydroxybenzoate octaprenyltransferase [Coxiella endosymbiont of Ornithodoros amblus]MBW5802415.1 4-hydroxybenzoate octaprenyltransferase [Coxiella endosymbiont of Ornithodoros amblus]